MNALVFLLATTPYLAGAEPAAPPATTGPATAPAPGMKAPAPSPAYSAPVASSYGGCGGCTSTCGDCGGCSDDCGRVGLCARLKARLHRSSCGECDCGCDSGSGGHKLFGRMHETCGGCDTCGSCDTCGDGCGGGLLSRLKSRLHRGACDSCGCDTCGTTSCSSCGAGAPAPAYAPMGPGGRPAEPVGAPKEMKRMPSDTTAPAPGKSTTPAKPSTDKPSSSLNLEPAPRADFSLDATGQNSFDLNRR